MKNLTELVFILDKSGSMAGMEKDTIGGFNSMIEKQKSEDGDAYVSVVLFSNYSEVLFDRKRLEDVTLLTEKDYIPCGCTALLDAIGGSIKHISNIHKYARKEDVPNKTIFVITTDGMENASRIYNYNMVKQMISEKEEKYGWKFLFAADNIDACKMGENIGIKKEYTANYSVKVGTTSLYEKVCETIGEFRKTGKIRENWNKDIKNK